MYLIKEHHSGVPIEIGWQNIVYSIHKIVFEKIEGLCGVEELSLY
jgi:hypothetical protein